MRATHRWAGRAALVLAVLTTAAALGIAAISITERRRDFPAAAPAERGGTLADPVALPAGVRRYIASANEWTAESATPARAVLLIHGLDEPGNIWDTLAPALADQTHAVLRFEYPNDQAVARSAEALGIVLTELGAHGCDELDIVAHSMGGLVARDALTRPGLDRRGWPGIGTLVMVGTPHAGSALAPLRAVADVRERLQHLLDGTSTVAEALDLADDGRGEAGRDLTPGSVFLTDLSARPNPQGVRLVCVVGRWAPPGSVLSDALGDGVVTIDSATLAGADEIIEVRGNHRGMLLSMPMMGEPAAVRAVVDVLNAANNTPGSSPPD